MKKLREPKMMVVMVMITMRIMMIMKMRMMMVTVGMKAQGQLMPEVFLAGRRWMH